MAIDETLLATFNDAGTDARPLLRTYLWSEQAVSIGYFDAVGDARNRFPGRSLVRRWTGGGNVEHGMDFTYSLLVPRRYLPVSWHGDGAYHSIHRAVTAVLRACGLESVTLTAVPAPSSPKDASQECFRRPVNHDVVVGGRKVAGGAQRRTRSGLLHQGSIQDGSVFFAPSGPVHRPIRAEMPSHLARTWEPRSLQETEFAAAVRLSASRYQSREWTEKF